MSRPLIGVTTSEVRLATQTEPLPEGDPPQREMALGMVYMRAVELAGGLPVVLPPLGHDMIAPLLDRLCGICLSGGPDIDPDGYGGEGVAILPHAEPWDVEGVRQAVLERPTAFVAQRMVMLSSHPTVVGGRLASRHVDLRPYVFLGRDGDARVAPGGLTRVAFDEGALVVNSSQNGGAKDTWVLSG